MSTVLQTKCCKGHGADLVDNLSAANNGVDVKVNLDYQEPCIYDTSKDKYAGMPWTTTTPLGASTSFNGQKVVSLLVCESHFGAAFHNTSDSNGGVDVMINIDKTGKCYYDKAPSYYHLVPTTIITYHP